MTDAMFALVAGALAAAAVAVLGLSITSNRNQAHLRTSLALVMRSGTGAHESVDDVAYQPARWGRAVLSALSDVLVLPANRRWLRGHLIRAGRLSPEDLQQALARKMLWMTVGAAVGLLAVLRWGWLGGLVLVAALLTGYFLPDLLAFNAGLKRTEQIRLTLPDALDLLDLCVESGLSLQAAMNKVAHVQAGPVAEEFARVLQEMRLGVARRDALEALADRATQSDLKQLIGAVLQAESLGIPIASVMREQASEMRAKRSSRARELAQKVPVKILAPLMLCFLPGLFIIILGPALITVVTVFFGR